MKTNKFSLVVFLVGAIPGLLYCVGRLVVGLLHHPAPTDDFGSWMTMGALVVIGPFVFAAMTGFVTWMICSLIYALVAWVTECIQSEIQFRQRRKPLQTKS